MSNFLLVYDSPMLPSVRICAHSFFCEFNKIGYIDYKAISIHEVSKQDCEWADVIVVGRIVSSVGLELCKSAKKYDKRLLFLLDDDLLNVPSNINSYHSFADSTIRKTLSEMLCLADGLISPSPVILGKYGKKKKNVLIEEPVDSFSPPRRKVLSTPIKIGFAGSLDRQDDVNKILSAALIKIKERYGERVEFIFLGIQPSFANEINARCINYMDDYNLYRETMYQLNLDIGLAPMPDTAFHSCKHYNKYIEYSSLGIVGVYSDVLPYSRLRQIDAPAILVANSAESWVSAICKLIENQGYLENEKKKCYQFALTHFNLSIIEKNLYTQFESYFNYKSPQREWRKNINGVHAVSAQIRRIIIFIKKNQLKSPVVAWKKVVDFVNNNKERAGRDVI